jgi:Flp pilus assembly protein TadD
VPEALNGLGLIALHSNNLDEALRRFRQATTAKPNFADAFNNLGVAYKQKGDKAQARLNYNRALQIDPGNKLAKENLENLENRPK